MKKENIIVGIVLILFGFILVIDGGYSITTISENKINTKIAKKDLEIDVSKKLAEEKNGSVIVLVYKDLNDEDIVHVVELRKNLLFNLYSFEDIHKIDVRLVSNFRSVVEAPLYNFSYAYDEKNNSLEIFEGSINSSIYSNTTPILIGFLILGIYLYEKKINNH